MITWEFYSKRRKATLESFLREIKTYEDAVKFFKEREISPPQELKDFYKSQDVKSKSVEITSQEKKNDVKVTTLKKTPTQKGASTKKTMRTPSKSKIPASKKTQVTKSKGLDGDEEIQIDVVADKPDETKDEKKPYFRKIIKPEKK